MIDIGTNGEIVYKGPEGCYSTSTAAGPALEGMNISCGMRAHVGAVERLDMDSDGKWTLEVIGNIEPQGFCGSGLLDGVAKLLDKGFIGKTGRFNKKNLSAVPAFRDKKFYFSDHVYLSQKDIRQVQLAKGAIASGIRILLKHVGVDYPTEFDRIYICGSFGYHLRETTIRRIGLLPQGIQGNMVFSGNTSLKGASMMITDPTGLERMETVTANVKSVELSNDEHFQEVFVKELNFFMKKLGSECCFPVKKESIIRTFIGQYRPQVHYDLKDFNELMETLESKK